MGERKSIIPDSFEGNVRRGMRLEELAALYSVNESTVSSWKQRSGLSGINYRSVCSIPADFEKNVRADYSRAELAVMYSVSPYTIGQWVKKAGLVGISSRNGWKNRKETPPKTTRSAEAERKPVEPEPLTPEEYRCWAAEAANPTSLQRAWRRTLTPGKRETVRRLDREATPYRWKPITTAVCTLEKPYINRVRTGR